MWKFKGIFTKEFNVVTFINFFLSMNFTTFFLFPLYIKNLGGTESDIGVIMGASGISAILAIPLSGYLSDLRVPKKIMIHIGIWLAVVASGTALLTTSLNIPLFAGIRLIQGISFSFSFMASSIFVAEIIPKEKRAQGIGMFGVFSLIPHALGPAIGEIILQRFDFTGVFAFSTLMGFAAFPFFFSLTEPQNEGDATKRQGMLAILKDPYKRDGFFSRARLRPDLRQVAGAGQCQRFFHLLLDRGGLRQDLRRRPFRFARAEEGDHTLHAVFQFKHYRAGRRLEHGRAGCSGIGIRGKPRVSLPGDDIACDRQPGVREPGQINEHFQPLLQHRNDGQRPCLRFPRPRVRVPGDVLRGWRDPPRLFRDFSKILQGLNPAPYFR
jgi:hypothetical protein